MGTGAELASPTSVECLRWSVLFSEELPFLPCPEMRMKIRQAAGVQRHVAATVLSVGYNPFIRAERGEVGEGSHILQSRAYRRLLGYLSRVLLLSNPAAFQEIFSEGATADASLVEAA